MISLLIPVHNFDVRTFVWDLHAQCIAGGWEFEILCYDDASTNGCKAGNREISGLEKVVYKELGRNLGRAAIRNLLAADAHHPLLLFMDCDGKVTSRYFVRRYLEASDGRSVVCGGRSYDPAPPDDPRFLLHWKYGREREQRAADERNRDPWFGFMTNSFLIPAPVFQRIRFDEQFERYGHEDTMFGLELERGGVPVLHIDNPVEHVGLEPAEKFLEKTRQGLCNLRLLEQLAPQSRTRLLSLWRWCRHTGVSFPVRLLFSGCRALLTRNLLSASPSLLLLDLYKLGYFASVPARDGGRSKGF